MSLMKDIHLRTAEQLGAAIRLKRTEKGLSQAALASELGVERKWILRLEAGNPKAELGLVLQALDTLGLQVFLTDRSGASRRADARQAPPSRLDEVFERLQKTARK
jgi:transcriptional regulator with XRE-family HTH domain